MNIKQEAENERLKKACEYNFALYQDMGVKARELAAERDELVAALKALLLYTPKEEWRGGFERGGYYPAGNALLKVINKAETAVAKYERDKTILEQRALIGELANDAAIARTGKVLGGG